MKERYVSFKGAVEDPPWRNSIRGGSLKFPWIVGMQTCRVEVVSTYDIK